MLSNVKKEELKIFDIVAIGESLIDFTPSGSNSTGMMLFSRNPGGAPSNVLAMASKLGCETAFIGKVGDDDFGHFLKTSMVNSGINVSGLIMTKHAHTTLAFVHLKENGERSFSFYRKSEADIRLKPDEVNDSLLQNCRIFHFGSVSLTDEPSRSATLDAVKRAKKYGAVISYDPNYRPPLWNDEKRAKSEMLNAVPLADIIKVSGDEMSLLTGETDYLAGAKKLSRYGASLVLITLGHKGSFYFTGNSSGLLNTYDVKTVDTNGAGDAFFGALLYSIRGMTLEEIKAMPSQKWKDIIAFGNAAGSLTTTQKGAIPAMPSLPQIKQCISHTSLLHF